ncbi:hypothetical protein CGZ80_06270 [Rhodopirellula sp. MGV]|nr:hypothetical protein CGZ80_06270 [Rhodopirellula sp. MGV]PNY36273.1 RNA-binding protein [Rhodopirellula baltica]
MGGVRFWKATMASMMLVLACMHVGCSDKTRVNAPGTSPSAEETPAGTSHEPSLESTAMRTPNEFVRWIGQAISRKDLATAETRARDFLIAYPNDLRAIELSGDIAAGLGKLDASVEMYQTALEMTKSANLGLLDKLTKRLVQMGRVFDATDALQSFVDRFPDEPQSRFDLVGLVTMIGLPERAVPSLRWLARRGMGDPDSLLVLANPLRVEPDIDWCQELLREPNADVRLEYSLARFDAIKQDWDSVLKRTRGVLDSRPGEAAAYVLYGRALIATGKLDQIPDWNRQAPSSVQRDPEYWCVIGNWAFETGQQSLAATSFFNVQGLAPTMYPAELAMLHQSLIQLDRAEDADVVAAQVVRQGKLLDAVKTHLERKANSHAAAMAVADAMIDLGRVWEAEAWARVAVSLPGGKSPNNIQHYQNIRSQLTSSTPWIESDKLLSNRLNLEGLASQGIADVSDPSKTRFDLDGAADLFFTDQSQQRGFVHTCEVAPEAIKEGHWIYQSVGGGVGIIDFDLDSFPDVAITMLDGSPMKADSSPNRLFRNLGDRFVEFGQTAGYVDNGFSQGIAIGDLNEDGFPDVFDANIGQNRLFINNGDGTFREAAVPLGLSDDAWSTSALIADLDADGISDLFATNYCGGEAPYQQSCQNRGRHSTCPPLQFEAAKDRVWKGSGDGTFSDRSDVWMNQVTPGRGLGLVGGSFDERPGVDVYVANDMTVNHLWSPNRSSPNENDKDQTFELIDLAAVRGVGLSGQSHSQASMGIATADADGDGDVDFFVTHFADDHNTFYEQVSGGFWKDQSYRSELGEVSNKLLGFGTEWADFDNNGTQELIVANGHVDNVYRDDVSYYMPAQVFYRKRSGEWAEFARDGLGEYFTKDHLGRALVTADLNRDGKVDVVITHLYEPAAMLINESVSAGNVITLDLKGTRSQRDAIGAIVHADVGDRQVMFPLTAGDGFMCSNERRISIGLGGEMKARNVTVTWPGGERQSFYDLDAGYHYLLIENSESAFQFKGFQ